MPEKMRTRPTNLAGGGAREGARARRSGDPRRVGGRSTPRAPERRSRGIRPWGARAGPALSRGCPYMPARGRFMHASSIPRQAVVRCGRRTGSASGVPLSTSSDGAGHDAPRVRPRDYAALSAGWGAALGTVLLVARDKGEEPVRPAEIVPLGVATFALAKLVAKEKVDKWVREPFVEEQPDGQRTPKGSGLRYAVGDLLTCTRCVGTWSALGLVALRVTRPREARVVNAVLGASAVNDWAQAGFNWLCAKSNAAQSGASEAESSARRVVESARFGR